SQSTALTDEQISIIEKEVNKRIRLNSEVSTRLLPVDEARAAGAMAMFGEKYDEEVRVISMGGTDESGKPFSMELCGGTHARRTGDIGLFRIIGESALAAGIRRIEGVTGKAALQYLNEQEQRLYSIAALLKTSPVEAPVRVEALINDRKKLEKEVSDLRRKIAIGGEGNLLETKVINGVNFTSRILEDIPPNELKPLADDMKLKIGSGVVALVSVAKDSKASLVVAVTSDLINKINAVDLVKIGAKKLGGKGGGGRPDMAQAGGPNGKLAVDAVLAIEAKLAG
ncbi:MAG: alanine--tRNA ligase, partial [Alphaproteobacteria bacterium]|nr:alanine--tRNA ligase [Alphaproteobacteria bacterium]